MKRESCRGSITVFFALLLTTLLALICTALESARQAAISYLAAQAEQSALESVFAGYYRPLWDRYHLLFLADGPGMEETMRDYLSYYEEPEKRTGTGGINLYAFQGKTVEFEQLITAVDNGGQAFMTAVEEDMKSHGMAELAEQLAEQSKLLTEAETVSDYMGQLAGCTEQVTSIEEDYERMEKQGRHLKEVYESLEDALESETFKEASGEALIAEARQCAEETASVASQYYGEICLQAKELQTELEREEVLLLEKREHVSQTSYEQMESELENLKEYTKENGTRRTAADDLNELLQRNAERLGKTTIWEDGNVSEDFCEAIWLGSRELDVIPDGIGAAEKQKSSLLDTVKQWKTAGILGLVLEDTKTVSAKSLPEISYPSDVQNTVGTADGSALWGIPALYAVTHLGYYGNEEETSVLAYEVEYILGKNETDRENLAAAVEKLLAVRTGLNFLYLLGDREKQEEAELAAVSLVGFTGIYPLVKAVKGVLLGAWAFAEAVCDVRVLLKGGEVPLIKSSADWRLSLEGASNAASCELDSGEKDSMWSYRAYLAVLLLMEKTKDQCFRMMDVMEANLRSEDSGFFMENCVSYGRVQVQFQAEPKFLRLPFPMRMEQVDSCYVFSKTAAYGYYD